KKELNPSCSKQTFAKIATNYWQCMLYFNKSTDKLKELKITARTTNSYISSEIS
ncbi:hypothetical protein BgiMline_031567, partial [Biomphalaria glabrata]